MIFKEAEMKRIPRRRLLAVIMSLAMTALVAGQATAAPRTAAALYPPSCNVVTDPRSDRH